MTNRASSEDRGSNAVKALESAWRELRTVESSIPDAVIVLIDGSKRNQKHGHFLVSSWKAHGKRWIHEVAISPHLFGDPTGLLATMLHEAAHACLWEKGKRGGMGSTRYYHATAFRDRCVELGLKCEFYNTRYGWSLTSWPSQVLPIQYRKIRDNLKKTLPFGSGAGRIPRATGKPLPKSGRSKLKCKCFKPRRIYVPNSEIGIGEIVCSLCQEVFRLVK